MQIQTVALGIVAAIAMALLLFFSLKVWPNARMRRRLRRTRDPIVSKSRQPSVKFSVKPPKE
jgi:hypothetical protein